MEKWFNILAIISLIAMTVFNITYFTLGRYSALAFVSLICFIICAIGSAKNKKDNNTI